MIYVQKSPTPPASLEIEKHKVNGKYNSEDVISQLKLDFNNKCYICEHDKPTNINVEHFFPHKNDVNLKYDWSNLYYACGHCNNTKLAKYDDILNCTNENDDVENRIRLYMDPFPKKNVVVTSSNQDQKTLNTVELLDKVYNGHTPTKDAESENLREYLLEELIDFQRALCDYYDAKKYGEGDTVSLLTKKIKRHLHAASPFTSFKRRIIKDSKALKEEFEYLFMEKINNIML